MQCYANISSGV